MKTEGFEELRKLLALKRYEQPPPGYFDRLPIEIITAIETEQLKQNFWLRRLWRGLQARPAFAGAFGAAVCALIVTGIFYVQKMDETSQPTENLAGVAEAIPQTAPGQLAELNSSSTNPVLSSQAPRFLFDASLLRSGAVNNIEKAEPVGIQIRPR